MTGLQMSGQQQWAAVTINRWFIHVTMWLVPAASAASQAVSLPPPTGLSSPLVQADSAVTPSHTGNLQLQWRLSPELEQAVADSRATGSDPARGNVLGELSFVVEERCGDEVALIEAGSHLKTALSGRDDGAYSYRVRAVAADGTSGPWSEPLELRVAHHPLWLAGLLFAIGTIVFLATAALIVMGHRRTSSLSSGADASPIRA